MARERRRPLAHHQARHRPQQQSYKRESIGQVLTHGDNDSDALEVPPGLLYVEERGRGRPLAHHQIRHGRKPQVSSQFKRECIGQVLTHGDD